MTISWFACLVIAARVWIIVVFTYLLGTFSAEVEVSYWTQTEKWTVDPNKSCLIYDEKESKNEGRGYVFNWFGNTMLQYNSVWCSRVKLRYDTKNGKYLQLIKLL